MAENLLRTGSATFLIIDPELEHRDDDPFILWLKEEGFKAQYFGHGNGTHAIYINVNARIYNWPMAGGSLSSCVFNHAIRMAEFKQIYSIFEKYKDFDCCIFTEEEQRKHDDWEAQRPILAERARRIKEEYFSQNPSYEEWLNDVVDCILSDSWYRKHWPEYTKEDILKDAEVYENVLRLAYERQEMPGTTAAEWDVVTM